MAGLLVAPAVVPVENPACLGLAFLVLAAVIDYNLYESGDRREDIEYMERILTLFRQAHGSLAALVIMH